MSFSETILLNKSADILLTFKRALFNRISVYWAVRTESDGGGGVGLLE